MILSIVTISYRFDEGLVSTLRSIRKLGDTKNIESIIVISEVHNNEKTLEAFLKSEIDWSYKIVIGKDKSIFNAMNIGTKIAKGKFIWYLNAQDKAISELDFEKLESSIADFHAYPVINTLEDLRYLRLPEKKGIPHQGFILKLKIAKKNKFDERFLSADHRLINYIRENYVGEYEKYPICDFDSSGITSLPSLKKFKFLKNESKLEKSKYIIKSIVRLALGNKRYFILMNEVFNSRERVYEC